MLTLGDNQYEQGELPELPDLLRPDWGRLKGITMPSPGNHDSPSSGYTPYFGAPANYSFDLGAWHLISLDSTAGGVTAATAFLESDLAQHTNRCVLAYWHHPRFSSDSIHNDNTGMSGFWNRLYGARADVVLSGHAHTYERFAPQTPAAVATPTGSASSSWGPGARTLTPSRPPGPTVRYGSRASSACCA